MPSRWGWGLISIVLLVSVWSVAREPAFEIRLTIKYNGKTVANPDHVTLSTGDHIASVPVRGGKFTVPSEIFGANPWHLSAIIMENEIRIANLSAADLAYEHWTLHFADRHYDEDMRYAVPKDAHVSSSCILVLDSEHIDPGAIMFQAHCRSKR